MFRNLVSAMTGHRQHLLQQQQEILALLRVSLLSTKIKNSVLWIRKYKTFGSLYKMVWKENIQKKSSLMAEQDILIFHGF